ncbi:MAG: hypothetical protein ABIH70_09230 [Chloroflexota bacterium]
MESWLPALFGFGGVLVGSLFSLWLTKLQLNNADKRFKAELAKAREDTQRQRQWNIRSDPLLKLRSELAIMATKAAKLAKSGHSFTVPIMTVEQVEESLREAERDWNNYMAGDYLENVLHMQADVEVTNKAREIRNEHLDTYNKVVTYRKELKAKEFGEAARAAEEKIRPMVAAAQELINKRLEEL